MTTIRVHHNRSYTTIANQAIQDKRLSFKARGVHHLLLSYPDTWEVRLDHIVAQSDKDGRDAVRAAFNELENCGYMTKSYRRGENGKFTGFDYDVFELPVEKPPHPDKGKSNDEKSNDEKSNDEKPDDEKSNVGKANPILNTKEINDLIESSTKREKEEPTLSLEEKNLNDPGSTESDRIEPVESSDRSPSLPVQSNPVETQSIGKGKHSAPSDFFAERAKYKTHPYPELCKQGLGHLWVGPGRRDFWQPLIEAQKVFLKKRNLPCEDGDAISSLCNYIRNGRWTDLEQREVDAKVQEQQKRQSVCYTPPASEINPSVDPEFKRQKCSEILRILQRNAAIRKGIATTTLEAS